MTAQALTFIDADTDLDSLLGMNDDCDIYELTGRYFVEEKPYGVRVSGELVDGGEQFIHCFTSVKAGLVNARRFVAGLERGEMIFNPARRTEIEIDGDEITLTRYR
jgi:hypothetical protein